MNECNEWGQIYILESITKYEAEDSKEAENIIERSTARLSHSNPAVVMAACKVVLRFMDYVSNIELLRGYTKKMAAALVTLLSCEPEI
jgi:vesicle coat complex subunit